ncbi:hypothetical protein OF83DRAFT_1177320 [Amylostereum chailletii]|nr:hypothetical protein OF83DRAFT_1177320 [Amylostereum chailletii]
MSNDDDFRLQLLSQKLSSLSTDDEKVSAALDFLEQTAASQGPVGLGTIFSGNYGPPVPSNPPPLYLDEHNAFDTLLEQHNIVDAFLASYRKRLDSGSKLPGARDHAFDRMPNCRLVAYCSTECQKAHWKLKPYGHKRDCKDRVLAETWQPAWVEEKRSPSFINESNAEIWTKACQTIHLLNKDVLFFFAKFAVGDTRRRSDFSAPGFY